LFKFLSTDKNMSRIELEAEALAIGLAAVAGLYYLYQARPTLDNVANITNKITGVASDAVDWATSGHALADTEQAIGEAATWVEGEAVEFGTWVGTEAQDAYAVVSGAVNSAIDTIEDDVTTVYHNTEDAIVSAITNAEQAAAAEAQSVWSTITTEADDLETSVANWWDNLGKKSTKKPKGQGKNAMIG